MGFSDWDFYLGAQTSGTVKGDIQINIASPITGTGSLLSTHTDGDVNAQTMNSLPKAASPLAHGFDVGRLQTLIRLDDVSGGTPTDFSNFGVIAMQSNRDVSYTASTKKAYVWSLQIGEGFNNIALVLFKLLNGLDVETGNLPSIQELGRVNNPFPGLSQGNIVALELEWRASPGLISSAGGAQLIGRAGLNSFSNLTDQLVFLDSSSPLGSTVGEGLFTTFKNSSVSDTKAVTFDDTSLYRLLI